jgi:DNA replication ATP-dependent helicase Dna2
MPQNMASQTPMKSSSQPELVERRIPPSTPAPRLPLADLLGNVTGRSVMAMNITPEEHVLWVHAQTPGSSQPTVTPARKRKRAKSSSPASSQQDQSNFFPNHQEAVTAEKMHNLFNTPQADPAADLWQRYANGTEGPVADKSAAFAHLIRDSSPKSPASAGSVGGLRRWASCGVEWPQSATKRRRVSRRFEELPQHEEVETDSTSKVSKVGALLERMKETLTKPALQVPEGPSSSSPLPDRTTVQEQEEHSPLQHRLPPIQEQDERSQNQKHSQPEQPLPNAASSDYGDDDVDTDMLDTIDSTTRLAQSALQVPVVPIQQMEQIAAARVAQISHAIAAPPQVPIQKHSALQTASDEFDDDDDDLLAVDLDQITANYATQHNAAQTQESLPQIASPIPRVIQSKAISATYNPPVSVPQVQPQAAVEIISDDEFGDDDIDDEQFAAVEAAATQAYDASGHVPGAVGLVIR